MGVNQSHILMDNQVQKNAFPGGGGGPGVRSPVICFENSLSPQIYSHPEVRTLDAIESCGKTLIGASFLSQKQGLECHYA